MLKKTFLLLIILFAGYAAIMINYPSQALKSMGYNSFLDLYATSISPNSDFTVLYNPGLRKTDIPLEEIKVDAVIPGDNMNYEARAKEFLAGESRAIVECSGMDAWHTSSSGKEYLLKIREKGYRIVVFDGGHHLPTLGLAADIIIIPEFASYAVHSYMLDGIKVEKVLALARKISFPGMIVKVPRWALVKNEKALQAISQDILDSSIYHSNSPEPFKPVAEPRISRTGNTVFAYVNKEYSRNTDLFMKRLDNLNDGNIEEVFLAFDYTHSSREEAAAFAGNLAEQIEARVEIVNEPVKLSNVFWGGR